MPTRYLSRDQRNRFGVFNGPVAPEDLAKYFVLDKHELHIIQNLRGAHNRLGYATLLCSVRFIGTFPEAVDSIPAEVLPFIRDQLKVMMTLTSEITFGPEPMSATSALFGKNLVS